MQSPTTHSPTTPALPGSRERASLALAYGRLPRLTLALLLAAALWLGVAPLVATPAPAPIDAPAEQFSAARALEHMAVIAAEPHPIGSARSAELRDYLVEQLGAAGLEPQVQRATLIRDQGIGSVSTVENVLARLPGTEGGPALLVSGHYDSVPTTAGAGDCSACSAVVLEALRAVAAGPPLAHDVIFLFTDGEEVSVAGAAAFMQQHPWAQEVAGSLVFEGLGPRGASTLYVTGGQAGWLTGAALRAAPHPTAYSAMHEIMAGLAGNTGSDLDAFLDGGAPGLAFVNLALAGAPAYHTAGDGLAAYDPGTLQDHGDWAVSLTRALGDSPLGDAPPTRNLTYFNLAPSLVVRYPGGWALPLALLAAAALLVALAVGVRRRRLSSGGLAMGALLWLAATLSAIVLVTLFWWGLRALNPHLHQYRVGGWGPMGIYLAAFCALAVAAGAFWFWLVRRRFSVLSLTAGALLWWALLGVLVARSFPGLGYLFAWPLLIASAALAWWVMGPQDGRGPWATALAAGLPALAAVLLAAPVIYVLGVYAGRMEGMMGIPAAALPIPVVMLALGMAAPALAWLAARRPGWLPPGALLLGVALLGWGWVASAPSAEQPATNTVLYWLDADTHAARWITVNDSRAGRGTRAQLDAWTGQFFAAGAQPTNFDPWLNGWFMQEYPALEAGAPVADAAQTPRSTATVLENAVAGTTRRVRLEITTPPTVLDGQIILEPAGAIADVTLNGEPLELGGPTRPLAQINRFGQTGTLLLEFAVPADAAAAVTLRDRAYGLPQIEGLDIAPRPATMIPAPFNTSADSTVVVQTIPLTGGQSE